MFIIESLRIRVVDSEAFSGIYEGYVTSDDHDTIQRSVGNKQNNTCRCSPESDGIHD